MEGLPNILHTMREKADSPTPFAVTEKPAYKLVRQYMMGDILGEGAQGKVREALNSHTLRRVAIKIVNLRHLRKIRNALEWVLAQDLQGPGTSRASKHACLTSRRGFLGRGLTAASP